MTEKKEKKISYAASFIVPQSSGSFKNPWTSYEYDKMDSDKLSDYRNIVKECRFFYKRDPIASTTINKLVDIGITDLVIDKGSLTINEMRILDAIKPNLQEFLELGAIEYLLSGLIVPEIEFAAKPKNELQMYGIKKHNSLELPSVYWLRDSGGVIINNSFIPSEPSYFIEVDDEIIFFVQSKGTYADGTEDREMYLKLAKLYPQFVKDILAGKKKVKLENKHIIRRRYLSDSPYPIPYLYSALESLKHKRNIRRMDYSIAARVISAVQLIQLGDKDFPLTEDDEDQFDDIRYQMRHRDNSSNELERVYQLFANHTLKISWVFPNMEALLDESKYKNVNEDIVYALGMPRILITGETARTGTSNPEWATMSPIKTMKDFRRKLLRIAKYIIYETLEKNNIKNKPYEVKFKDVNMREVSEFVEALVKLYDTGNLSRKTLVETLGFNFEQEVDNRAEEKDLFEEKGIPDFNPTPFSPGPGQENNKNIENKEEDNG
jgi:hypothetical protein